MAPAVHIANTEDVPAIADIFLRCFEDEYFMARFPHNEHGRAYAEAAWEGFITSKARRSQEGRVLVTRDEEGRVAGACLVWIVKPEDSGVWSWRKRWPPANKGQKDELLDEFFRGMHDQHETIMGEKEHIYFELVIVDPLQHRKGHARALVQHAAKIADDLGYDSYLDADEEVMPLYIQEGYVDRKDIKATSFMKPMVRQPRAVVGLEDSTAA